MQTLLLIAIILVCTLTCLWFAKDGPIATLNDYNFLYYNLNFISPKLIKFVQNDYLRTTG
ncbi:hypothetical protein [Neodiprion abietis nucleopolyhedrovirus]|uniref:Uncharacterized protein n=1 Tax=Neodiprion abietis nucleopolyhedrovirus TaxID=204507 RepID=Q0ZP10_9CBAC|nr:hypothetical protein [Neodiprion abietis nucleopolyhedrovirus]ABC74944.1 unknown [Neodiprion abietis nucleopolyhedrovirus]